MESEVAPNPLRLFKQTLVTRLRERAGLDGVRILHAEMPRIADKDHIYVINGGAPQVSRSNGTGRRKHTMTLRVSIVVYRKGLEEKQVLEVEDRAFALLHELENELEGSIAGKTLKDERQRSQVIAAEVGEVDYDAAKENGHRWFQIWATVKAEADTTLLLPP